MMPDVVVDQGRRFETVIGRGGSIGRRKDFRFAGRFLAKMKAAVTARQVPTGQSVECLVLPFSPTATPTGW